MRFVSHFVLSSLVLVACASPRQAARPTPPPPAPDAGVDRSAELAALFERESQPAAPVTFNLGELPVSTESSEPVAVTRSEENGVTSLSIGVGASTPMTCQLFDQPVDLGHVISNAIAGMRSVVEITGIRPGGIEVVEKAPAVFLHLRYTADQNGQKAVGMASLMGYASDVAPMLCIFDEPGYAQSFHRVASAAAVALAKALTQPGAEPTYRNVSITRVQGVGVGFGITTWRKNPDGSGTFIAESTMVAPKSATEWITTDQTTVETVAKDGTLKEKRMTRKQGEQLDRDLSLTRTKAGVYHSKGTAAGKALDVELKTADHKDLPSDVLISRWTKKRLLTGKVKSLAWEEYGPELKPDAFTPITMVKGEGADTVILDLGPMQMKSTVDAFGVLADGAIETGGTSIVSQRAFTEGKLE